MSMSSDILRSVLRAVAVPVVFAAVGAVSYFGYKIYEKLTEATKSVEKAATAATKAAETANAASVNAEKVADAVAATITVIAEAATNNPSIFKWFTIPAIAFIIFSTLVEYLAPGVWHYIFTFLANVIS